MPRNRVAEMPAMMASFLFVLSVGRASVDAASELPSPVSAAGLRALFMRTMLNKRPKMPVAPIAGMSAMERL